MIWCFNAGTLPIAPDEAHVTLRSYLAEKLDCDPMRITKKYTGASCLGKKVYRIARNDDVSPDQLAQDQLELQMLEKAFLAKLDQIRSKKVMQGLSEARRSQNKDVFSPSMSGSMRPSLMMDGYSSSSSYTAGSPPRTSLYPPKSLSSPTSKHYSLPSSLLEVTNDHYMEQLKNDAAEAAAAANAATSLNNENLIRIPSLNSDLLFDTFGGPGSAFSSMGNLSGFGSFFAANAPQEPPQSSQFQEQQAGQGGLSQNTTPYKHKLNWIQRSAAAEAGLNVANGVSLPSVGVSAGASQSYPVKAVQERVSGDADSPSRATHNLSPDGTKGTADGVINDDGDLPAGILEHRQLHEQQSLTTMPSGKVSGIGLPDVYRTCAAPPATVVGSPATSYDDSTVSSSGSKKRAGLTSHISSTSSSDSALGEVDLMIDPKAVNYTATTAAISASGTEDSQHSTQSGNDQPGFKKRKMSEDMTAAASSLLGFFSQFQNGFRENYTSIVGNREKSGVSQGSSL